MPGAKDLPTVLQPLAEDMTRVEAAYRDILGGVSARSQDVIQQSAAFAGKRLRPGLTLLSARICEGRVREDVATVAAVIELIHTATLVHDDILDAADVRRQIATVNARFGEQAAVLAGDVLFSRAYRAAAYLDDPFAARYLSDVVGEVLEGEIHQDLVAHNATLKEDDYRAIIRGKTAALYEGALRVGAHYARGTPEQVDALGRFGHHLGMAFQIVDDHLDLAGQEEVVGKSLGRDLAEGKTTLPVILWRDALSEEDRAAALKRIEAAWQDEDASASLIATLRESGAFARSAAAAEYEITCARACLETLPACPEIDLLRSIADYVRRRTR